MMTNKIKPAEPPPTQTKLPNIGDVKICIGFIGCEFSGFQIN
jgi:hypothetical protein